jgi:hypothetical protein
MAASFGYADGIMALGSIIGLGFQLSAARSAERTAGYQADIISYNTRYVDAKVKLEQARIDRETRQIIGAQRAQTAAGGIAPDIGTPAEFQAESRIMADIDKALVRISGGMERLNITTNALLTRAGGASEASRYYGGATATSLDYLGNLLNRHGSSITNLLKPKSTTPRPGGFTRSDLNAIKG